jgi:hypothetical protein
MVIDTMTCVSTSNISVNNAHLAIALMTHTINIADIAIKRVLLTTESTTDSLDGGALELRESLVSLPVYTTMQTALYHPYQEKEGENEKQIVVNNAQGGWKHRRHSEKRRRAHANKHFHIKYTDHSDARITDPRRHKFFSVKVCSDRPPPGDISYTSIDPLNL